MERLRLQCSRIQKKLAQLKRSDSGLFRRSRVFGAKVHRYRLNPPVSIEFVETFEHRYALTLPKEYVTFITQIGNGGAGPFYGLMALAQAVSCPVLNVPFPHVEAWNMTFETHHPDVDKKYREFEQVYFDDKWLAGTIPLSHFGCGVMYHLVVSGKEYGNIWVDDRASDNGIYPLSEMTARTTFLDWYERWLDNCLAEL